MKVFINNFLNDLSSHILLESLKQLYYNKINLVTFFAC